MAGKSKSVYICSQCGYESAKWFGCCPGCGEWNTMNEEIKAATVSPKASAASAHGMKTYALNEITADEEIRYKTGLSELDRVLGGGIVKGSLVLLSGDPANRRYCSRYASISAAVLIFSMSRERSPSISSSSGRTGSASKARLSPL